VRCCPYPFLFHGTPDKLFLTGVSGSVPRFASLKTRAVEYVGFLLIQRTGKQRKAYGFDSDPLIEVAAQHLRVLDKRTLFRQRVKTITHTVELLNFAQKRNRRHVHATLSESLRRENFRGADLCSGNLEEGSGFDPRVESSHRCRNSGIKRHGHASILQSH
jgi:hypothetical protein